MVKITYEDKIIWLNEKRNELIERSKKYTSEVEYDKYLIDIIECIMEDVDQIYQLEEQCQKQDKESTDIYEEMFLK